RARLATFGGKAGAQFEIARVKERLAAGSNAGHGTAEDVAGGHQTNVEGAEGTALAESQDVFEALAGKAGLHQARGGRAEDHLPMRSDVVRMRVAYENLFRSGPGPMRIKPQV